MNSPVQFGTSRLALRALFLGVMALLACSEPESKTPGLPAEVKESWESYELCRGRLLQAEENEGEEVADLRAEIQRRRDELCALAGEKSVAGVLAASLAGRISDLLATDGRPLPRRTLELWVDLLSKLGAGKHFSVLVKLCRRSDAGVFLRLQAADAMAEVDAGRAAAELLTLLRGEKDPEGGAFESTVIKVLRSRVGREEIIRFSLELLRGPAPAQARLSAAFLARDLADPRFLDALRGASEDPHVFVRINAIQSLAILVGEPLLPFLIAKARREPKDSREREGLAAALSVAKRGPGALAGSWTP